jgi:spermidine synthase
VPEAPSRPRLRPSAARATGTPVALRDVIALGALFASGCASLMYQVCWIRKASLVFGSTTFAVSTVTAVFFLGLAWGSYLFGRVAHRSERPLRAFALIEIGLGAFALASPLVFQAVDSIYGALYRAAPGSPWLHGTARAVLVGLAIVPATTAMGATLPLFSRRYAGDPRAVNRAVGFLYGLNTLGAAAGAAVAGFVLLPRVGLGATIRIAAAISLVAGAAVGLGRTTQPAAEAGRPGEPAAPAPRQWLALLLYFGVGFVALGLEVAWFRFLSLIIRNTVYTYTLVLAVVLLGIVLGSWAASRLASRDARRGVVFGLLQVVSALTVLALTGLPTGFWNALQDELWVCVLLLLVPSAIGGASFPIAVQLVMGETASAAIGVGLAAAANTLGGVLGSLAVGFLVLPYAGVQPAIWILTAVGLAIGSSALLWLAGPAVGGARAGSDPNPADGRRARRRRAAHGSSDHARPGFGPAGLGRVAGVAAAWAAWIAIAAFAPARVPADYLAESGGTLVDYRQGFGADLAVIEQDGVTRLEIDRWWQGENRRTHQALSAHVPTTLRPAARSVLLVGVGVGQTASRFLMHDIGRLDCVDIEPALFDVVRRHFDSAWMTDPRTHLIVEDGRLYLRHAPARYDIISLELGQPFRPGVAYFYTRDAYAYARRRLNPDGLVVQFLPLTFFTPDQVRAVVATFLDVFPQSVLWYNTSELLLIGANAPEFRWPADLPANPPWSPAVSKDLDFAYWGGPAESLNRTDVFLGGFIMGPDGLAALAGSRRPLGDDRPMLDYGTARADQRQGMEIENARLLRDRLAPLPAAVASRVDEAFRLRVRAIQASNVGDIAAAALIRRAVDLEVTGDLRGAEAALREALQWNDRDAQANPFLGDLLLRQDRPEEALPYLQTTVRILPGDADSLAGVAMCLHRTGRAGEAVEYYRQSLALDPSSAETHNNLGAALASLGIYEEARQEFRDALRLQPDYPDAQRNLNAVPR